MTTPGEMPGGGGKRDGGMGRGVMAIALAVLAASAGYVVYSSMHRTSTQAPPVTATAPPGSSPTPRVAPRAAAAPFTRSEWGYRWDASKPGIAASEADAAWLESKGYPGPDVEDHLRRLSLQELQALAARGNQPATAIYAYRLAASGAPRAEVLALLSRSASEGSVYALKTAADIHMMVQGYRDPALASAYYGLLARAGDQSGFEQRYLLSHQLDSTQRFQSDLMQEQLWRDINAAHPAAGEEPRPGFDEFLGHALGAKPEL